jgi:hypothetical protein
MKKKKSCKITKKFFRYQHKSLELLNMNKRPNWQKWMNKVAASVRSGIERTNATLKNWYGMARVRDLGLARNHCHLQLVACALNAKRALVLIKARAA